MLLTLTEQRPGVIGNTLQSTGQPPKKESSGPVLIVALSKSTGLEEPKQAGFLTEAEDIGLC